MQLPECILTRLPSFLWPNNVFQCLKHTSGGRTSGLAAFSWLSSTGWIRSLPEPCTTLYVQ